MADDKAAMTEVYFPQRMRGWIVLGMALFLSILWLTVTLGVAMQPPPKDPNAQPVGAGPGIILALILWPAIALFLWIGLGIIRMRLRITEDALDMTAHRFAIWSLRSTRHARLAWSEVHGVQLFEQSNPYAPDGVQKDYVIHTTQGRFALSNILWTHAAEIAAKVEARIGREIGQLPASVERIDTATPGNRLGLKVMHGCGMVAMVLCGVMFLLLGLALIGGMPLADFAKAAMFCGVGFSGGVAMWKWRMKS